jgi:hypothetical protein
VGLADTLWLNRLLPSKKRLDDNFRWQQRLIGLASHIIGIERRARDCARNKGMEREVEEAAPEETEDEADIEENVTEMTEENGRFAVIKRLVNS